MTEKQTEAQRKQASLNHLVTGKAWTRLLSVPEQPCVRIKSGEKTVRAGRIREGSEKS